MDSKLGFTRDNAKLAADAYINTYWDSTKKYFFTYSDHQIHEHAVGPENGLYTDYWWEAQLFEMVMDCYENIGDASYLQLMADVYDGFFAYYSSWWENNWNDDMGWWARACIRAFEITGDNRYLVRSEEIFTFIWRYWDDTYGGGIWWKNVNVGDGDNNEKNVATNATAVYVALRLYKATGVQSYFDKANEIFNWLNLKFYNGGHISDHISGDDVMYYWDWTYNNGDYAGAALQMYIATNDADYLKQATTAIDWAVEYLTLSGTFIYEGMDDTGGFKSILVRNMNDMVKYGGQTQYVSTLQFNATQAYNHINSGFVGGYDWTAPTGEFDKVYLESLGAASTVVVLMSVVADNYVGIVEGNNIYEAENSVRNGVDSETNPNGYSGRGYIAGWINDGTNIIFNANIINSGVYTLTFRYSAGAGDSVRQIYVNSEVNNVAFVATTDWDTWEENSYPVELSAGYNEIKLTLDSASGSENYLNVDYLKIVQDNY